MAGRRVGYHAVNLALAAVALFAWFAVVSLIAALIHRAVVSDWTAGVLTGVVAIWLPRLIMWLCDKSDELT